MASISTKFIIGTATAGGIAGGGYLVSVLTDTTDTIENYLKGYSFELVSQDELSITEWNKVFETYQIEQEEEDLKITGKEIKKGEDIKAWCKDTISKSVKSTKDPLFKKMTYWCTKYKTIAERIGSENLFQEQAEELEKKHNQLPEPFKSEIKNFKLSFERTANQNGEKIKQWCKDNKKRKFDKRNKTFVEKITSHCLINPTKLEI